MQGSVLDILRIMEKKYSGACPSSVFRRQWLPFILDLAGAQTTSVFHEGLTLSQQDMKLGTQL